MASVHDLELPEFDVSDASLDALTYHEQLAALRERTWLARSPIALLVLDRAAGEFFLRSKSAAFPGREIAALFDITTGPLFEHIDANILNLTGAQHRRLRSIVSRAFTPVAADRWRPTMTRILAHCGRDAVTRGPSSRRRLAKPYPALAIAPSSARPDDAPRLHEWSTWVQRQFDIRASARGPGDRAGRGPRSTPTSRPSSPARAHADGDASRIAARPQRPTATASRTSSA